MRKITYEAPTFSQLGVTLEKVVKSSVKRVGKKMRDVREVQLDNAPNLTIVFKDGTKMEIEVTLPSHVKH